MSLMYRNNHWQQGPLGPVSDNQHFPREACTVKMDNQILMTGGEYGMYESAWVFNQTDSTWTKIASMNHGLGQHGCVSLPNGDVMVAGRAKEDGKFVVEVLAGDTMQWHTLDSNQVPNPINFVIRMFLIRGRVILLDAFSKTFYSRQEDQDWLKIGNLPGFRDGFNTGAVAVPSSFACT